MSYSEKDFGKCLFNPASKDFIEQPRLSELKGESSAITEKMLKYVIATYDPNSPFVRDYRDVRLRKQAAAMFAGYDIKKDDAVLAKMFDFTSSVMLELIDRFLKDFVHSRLWYMICANEQTFYEYAKRMMKPIDESDSKEKDIISAISTKSKLSADMAEINDRLEAGYRKMYGEDELVNAVRKGFTPESMATKV